MDLVVATYNIAGAVQRTNRMYGWLRSNDSAKLTTIAERNLPRIAEILGDAQAEIVALQEADTCFDGTRVLPQWQLLAGRLGMRSEFTPSTRINLLGGVRVHSGVAILSAHPLSTVRRVDFEPRYVERRARLKGALLGRKAALHTTTRVGGVDLHVVTAHLTHDSVRQREHELATLLSYCSELDPVLIMGDLNFTPRLDWAADVEHPQPVHDDCLEILRTFDREHAGLLHCDPRLFSSDESELRALLTGPADAPRYKFDYILLLTRNPRIRLGPETVLNVDVSDHRPVAARLTVERS